MAIYHLSTKPVKRSDGRSATASSAYRSGTEVEDKRTGLTHNYTKKSGVVTSDCFAIQSGEKVQLDRNELWNKAEETERRKDSRTAREIVVSIPHELPKEERQKLVDDFSQQLAERYKCAIDYAIHTPDKEGDNRNHHAHIMMTTRSIEINNDNQIQLTDKTSLELSNRKLKELDLPKTQQQIKTLRADWANLANERLKENDINARIDHRSHKDRGLETKPTVKEGWKATQLERQGILTEVGDLNRQIKAENAEIERLEDEVYCMKNDMEWIRINELDKEREDNKYQEDFQNAHIEPIVPSKKQNGTKPPQKDNIAINEPNNTSIKPKKSFKELKEDIKKFEQLINKVAEDLHPEHIKQLEDKAKVFVIEKEKPAYEDLQAFKGQEPKEPLNPFKKGDWKKDHQSWRNEYLDKLHSYKDLQRESEGMKQDIKDLKNKGAKGSRGYAVAIIKAKIPELYEKYEKAVDKVNEGIKQEQSSNMVRQLEQMREKRQDDRGFER